jgi:flavin reductase (DIM6/NTAB) family NADH-FMN oxidoreductase RutF
MRALAEQVGRFGISILHAGQGRYARHYARRDRGAGPALAGDLVPGCVAYFACELHCIYPVGDHDLIVGEVTACDVPDAAGRPLIFLDGGYHEAVPALRGEQQ